MLIRENAASDLMQPNRMIPALLLLGYAGAAVLLGAVIATGRPGLLGVAVGAIFGIVLLNALHVAAWITLIGVLLVSGPLLMFVPELGKLPWLFSMLGFFMAAASFLYLSLGRTHFKHRAPMFVTLALVFVVYTLIGLVLHDASVAQGVASIKRWYQYWGLMFLLAVVPIAPRTVYRWGIFLIVLAVLQLPFALYQRIVLVPLREPMVEFIQGLVPIDIVVGTFEGLIYGGGSSSVLALFSIAMLAFLLAAYRDGAMSGRRTLLLGLLTAAPLALGETKIVLFLLPIALWAVYADLVRKRPLLFAFGAVLMAATLAGLLYLYTVASAAPNSRGVDIVKGIEETLEYNIGNKGYGQVGALNRASVLTFWASRHGMSDPVATVFGHGLGSSHSGEGALVPGPMAQRHRGLFIGLTAGSALLWDTGVLGFLLYVGVLLAAARAAQQLAAKAPPGIDRAMCRTLQGTALMLLPMVAYSDALIAVPSLQVLMALTLGLIAWRWRMQGSVPQPAAGGGRPAAASGSAPGTGPQPAPGGGGPGNARGPGSGGGGGRPGWGGGRARPAWGAAGTAAGRAEPGWAGGGAAPAAGFARPPVATHASAGSSAAGVRDRAGRAEPRWQSARQFADAHVPGRDTIDAADAAAAAAAAETVRARRARRAAAAPMPPHESPA